MSFIEELLELGAFAGMPIHTGEVMNCPVELWRAIKAAWNEKRRREAEPKDGGRGKIVVHNSGD